MSPYRTSVATLDIPDSWRDQSIVAFRLPPAPGGGEASFVMTKDMAKGTAAFAGYFAAQADSCARSLPDYHELRRDLFQAHERDAAWLEFRWTNERSPMQLRQVYFDCGFFAAIFTLTTTPADMAYHDAEWRRVMSRLVFDPAPPATAFP